MRPVFRVRQQARFEFRPAAAGRPGREQQEGNGRQYRQQRADHAEQYLRLQAHRQGLDSDSLAAAVAAVDVVLDCSDNFSTREAVNAACVAAKVPLVSGAAIRLEGQLSVFDPRREDSPCYHCIYGHGSEAELTCSEAGVAGPLVGLVGSLQALEALKSLAPFGEPLVGRLLLIDALGSRFRELRVKRDPGCSVCGSDAQ